MPELNPEPLVHGLEVKPKGKSKKRDPFEYESKLATRFVDIHSYHSYCKAYANWGFPALTLLRYARPHSLGECAPGKCHATPGEKAFTVYTSSTQKGHCQLMVAKARKKTPTLAINKSRGTFLAVKSFGQRIHKTRSLGSISNGRRRL